jgi:hypothetical protein
VLKIGVENFSYPERRLTTSFISLSARRFVVGNVEAVEEADNQQCEKTTGEVLKKVAHR